MLGNSAIIDFVLYTVVVISGIRSLPHTLPQFYCCAAAYLTFRASAVADLPVLLAAA